MFVQLRYLIGLLSSQNYEQYKGKTARLFFSSCGKLGENMLQKQFIDGGNLFTLSLVDWEKE